MVEPRRFAPGGRVLFLTSHQSMERKDETDDKKEEAEGEIHEISLSRT